MPPWPRCRRQRPSRFRTVLLACTVSMSAAAAPSANTAAPPGSGAAASAEPDADTRAQGVAGLLVYPYSSDEAFGAGFQAGFRKGFAVLMFREGFMRSTQYEDEGSLLRLRKRLSFEISLEAQGRVSHFTLYGGLGAMVRHDAWERTEFRGDRFVSSRSDELVPRPIIVLGLLGSAVEANAVITVQEHPELRLGLGFVIGR